ncbi:MAG: hypothetical protein ACP5RE_04030, partial [Candidatus Acidifodinimicrobium sp.]
LPFTKDIKGIQYKPFTNYKTDTTSDKLPLSTTAYWHTLEDVLTQYVRHDDHKFDYDNEGIAHRKHIIADRIRYIGKESNNLDETQVIGIDEDSYLEYENLTEFYDWVLSLKPKDVRDKGISKQTLWNVKEKIRDKKIFKHNSKPLKKLKELYITK